MKRIKTSNFRKVKDTWDLDLAPITFFTGTNNSGKSTILKSLLLLEDHINSENHFELDFNGENAKKHKIDCYDNAINRLNKAENNKDLFFEYSNRGYDVRFWFEPSEEKTNGKGKLVRLEIERDDKAKLTIYHTGGLNYQLEFDNTLLERRKEPKDEESKIKDLALFHTIKNLLEEDEKELSELEKNKTEIKEKLFELRTNHLIGEDFNYKKLNIQDYVTSLGVRTIAILEIIKVNAGLMPAKIIDEMTSGYLIGEFGLDFSKKTFSDSYLELSFFLFEKEIKSNTKKIISLKQEITESKKKLKIANKKLEENDSKARLTTTYLPEFSLEDFHPSERTIEKVIREVLPKYLRTNDKSIKLAGIGNTITRSYYALADKFSSVLSFSIDHLSPHRNNQTRLYINNNTSTDINELIKEHANNPIHRGSKAGVFLKNWMKEFDIGDNYDIKSIDGVASKILVLESNNWVNLVDKGFGAGQIFAILLKITLCINSTKISSNFRFSYTRKQLIVIEEPEANLHPALQSKLTDLFFDAYDKFKIRFIIETHSEYILRKSQITVKSLNNENLEELPFAVYYFDKEKGPYEMNYNNDGKFSNEFGSGFFDVSTNLAFDIL
ncbi:AAA family ATPase [Tenacibaculum ovolyticum]|uniref:AAA family ATPase n=1 Tax=Tenacibaculum ovolyticum TaxID=104270 RepID=UPI0022F3BB7B|nr:AAA family ATPase [Tenacibaculum ovolyticum]WBX78102.1 AAA family ATPase [Tenacibaculum ovolyticum]